MKKSRFFYSLKLFCFRSHKRLRKKIFSTSIRRSRSSFVMLVWAENLTIPQYDNQRLLSSIRSSVVLLIISFTSFVITKTLKKIYDCLNKLGYLFKVWMRSEQEIFQPFLSSFDLGEKLILFLTNFLFPFELLTWRCFNFRKHPIRNLPSDSNCS